MLLEVFSLLRIIINTPYKFTYGLLCLLMVFHLYEWQQVSSCLQESSQYSDRSYQCCSLNSSSSDFHPFQPPFPSLCGPFQLRQLQLVSPWPSCPIAFSSFLATSKYLPLFSFFSIFTQWSDETAKSAIRQVFFFCYWLSQGLVFWPGLGDLFHLKILVNFICLILLYGFFLLACVDWWINCIFCSENINTQINMNVFMYILENSIMF